MNTEKQHSVVALIPYLVILLPYIYYILNQHSTTQPIILSDSFRYMWDTDFSLSFFYGSSLSYRIFVYLLGNEPWLVANVMFILYFFSEVAIYLVLRSDNYRFNLAIALILVFIYDSNFLVGVHFSISPEGFFMAMNILFIAALFLAKGTPKDWIVFAISVVFIFSRNVAPYVAFVGVFVFWLLSRRDSPGLLFTLVIPVACIALAASSFNKNYDSSVQMNVANNVIGRVLQDPFKQAIFEERYGLPINSFDVACKNTNNPSATSLCFEHMKIHTTNMSTYNYELVKDGMQGLYEWVRSKGINAWQHYILIERPIESFREFAGMFKRNYEKPFRSEESQILPIGYFDSIREVTVKMGVSNFWTLLGFLVLTGSYCLVSLSLPLLRFPLTMSACSLANIFVSYFGDSMEIKRHTYPGYVTLDISLGLLFICMLTSLFFLTVVPGQRKEKLDSCDSDNG